MTPLDRAWTDQALAALPAAPNHDMVVVAIDDDSLAKLGPWPWTRELHARLVDRLTTAQSSLVVLTTGFGRPESKEALAQLRVIADAVATDPALAQHAGLSGLVQQTQDLLDGDGRLALSLAQNGRTLLPAVQRPGGGTEWPLAELASAALGVGGLAWQPDDDGMLREVALRSRTEGRELPALALWVAASAQGRHPAEATYLSAPPLNQGLAPASGRALNEAHLAAHRWPTDARGWVRPRWQDAARSQAQFERVSAAAVLQSDEALARLAGRIALVGATTSAVEAPLAVASLGPVMPVDLLAQYATALMRDELAAPMPAAGWAQAGCMLAALLLVVGAAPRMKLRASAGLALLLTAVWVTASYFAVSRVLWVVSPWAPVAALWLGLATWALLRDRTPAPPPREATSTYLGVTIDRLGSDTVPVLDADFLPAAATEPVAAAVVGTPPAAPPMAPSMQPVPLSAFSALDAGSHDATVPSRLHDEVASVMRPVTQPVTQPGTRPIPQPVTPPVTRPMVPSVMATPAPVGRKRLPQLGRFQLIREIGRGAMGRVYLAEEVGTARQAAVKTLALAREFEGFALREARGRFQREALAALRLQHPDIVKILDAGEDQGYAWIAMELLTGHDLVRHTQPVNLLPVPQVLHVCARIAGALAHAHGQGIVHRDIKPANVMVDLDRGLVKVTDFGIARITDAARTRTGLVLGSPSYMSPEQLAGRQVDGRSDIYSLGVVMFQLLTGTLPAAGGNMAELMHAVANEPAPDVRERRPRLPEPVANVVALAMEKRAELRYPDAAALQADLHSVLSLWSLPPAGASVEEVAGTADLQARQPGAAGPIVQNQPA